MKGLVFFFFGFWVWDGGSFCMGFRVFRVYAVMQGLEFTLATL